MDYTFYKLSQVYRKIVMEARLAKRNKRELEISRALVEPDLTRHIKDSGGQIQ
ncbi:MAG TPA: DUF1819 family protein [Firmicutes bacterium]|nr:DUF1819 family protein [Bacillota bacterium]